MNDSTRVMRRPRRARPPAARTAAAIIATAVLALLAAACGGSPSSTGSGGSSNAGGSASSQIGISRSLTAACARTACRTSPTPPAGEGAKGHPAASSGSAIPSSRRPREPAPACSSRPQAQVPQIMTGLLNFARCMRSHGVPNWPDPTTDRNGQPVFDIPGINPDSPRDQQQGRRMYAPAGPAATTGPTTIQLCRRQRRRTERTVTVARPGGQAAGGVLAAAEARGSRGRGRWAALGIVAVVAAGAVSAWRAGVFSPAASSGAGPQGAPPATAAVARQDIAATTPVTATLGYAGSYPVPGRAAGR